MADLGTCLFNLCRERIGNDDSVNYERVLRLPLMYVKNISLDHSLEKQIVPRPPDSDTGEENDPIILPLGVKSKNITMMGTFEGTAYIYGDTTPPFGDIKQNLVLQAADEDSRDNFPELDDGDGYWRIKSANWETNNKSMMWEMTLTLSYIWTTYNESMFFGE